jgi:ankyrin repeat protein
MNLGLISTLRFKTALHWAAKNGQIEMVDFLLALGDGVNTEMRTV